MDAADLAIPDFPRKGVIAVLGLGLIGGSIGLALRGSGTVDLVVGWDLDPQVGRRAFDRGACDGIATSASEAARHADVVVIAVPLPATIPLLVEIAPHLEEHAIVTDVGSLKETISEEAERILSGRFVGGHPMAGSDTSGIDAARADLFNNASWFLTPSDNPIDYAVHAVESIVTAVGASPRICDAAAHDRIVAALSHLPHLLAYGLAQTASNLVPDVWRSVAAGSFRDGTRVAGSDPELWRAVFLENSHNILHSLNAFEAWTGTLRRAISEGDEAKVAEMLRAAHKARGEW